MKYPIYRKYFNGTSYFKILSDSEFLEIQIIGSKKTEIRIKTDQFPERLRIQDMIACRDNAWIEISESEYQAMASIPS